MYAIIPQQIPQGKRAEINEKILFAINSGKDLIPAESIYNCYTGIGGLHNLKQSDFASFLQKKTSVCYYLATGGHWQLITGNSTPLTINSRH